MKLAAKPAQGQRVLKSQIKEIKILNKNYSLLHSKKSNSIIMSKILKYFIYNY